MSGQGSRALKSTGLQHDSKNKQGKSTVQRKEQFSCSEPGHRFRKSAAATTAGREYMDCLRRTRTATIRIDRDSTARKRSLDILAGRICCCNYSSYCSSRPGAGQEGGLWGTRTDPVGICRWHFISRSSTVIGSTLPARQVVCICARACPSLPACLHLQTLLPTSRF